jgi:signal transduction histidine kinase
MTLFKRQEDNLRRIATKLQSTNATKDKIFSIISHDLRGPIGNLKSMIEFIAENQNEFDMAEIVDIMKNLKQSSSTTYELLENLLSWAKSQQNLLEYKPTIFNISEIIKNTVELSNQYAKNKLIGIQNYIEDNIDVIGDENMIKTVIRNLLSNSIKFTKSNGKIFVNGSIDDDFVIISIKDTGIGMNQDTAVKLFDDANFFTTYGTNNEKGTGLGLKLCKDFLSKNSGKIWVESEPNIGSTFYFTIRKA